MPCKEAVVYFIFKEAVAYFIFKGRPREGPMEHNGIAFSCLHLQEILKVASISTVKEEGESLYRGLSRHSPRELPA